MGTENCVHFLKEETEAERGVATVRSEVAAEAALAHRSQNSQPGLFLTPETQWDAVRFGVSETRLCHPARAAVLEVPR